MSAAIIKGKDDQVLWNHSVKLDADEEQAIRHLYLLDRVHTGLQTLTNETFGSHKEWNGWWKAYGSKFKIETR